MAFHIIIEKVSETTAEAVYAFHDSAFPAEAGELRLDKVKGVVSMTKPAKEAFFHRAAQKVSKAFSQGALPQTLEWAS